jgi:hypothetical protein
VTDEEYEKYLTTRYDQLVAFYDKRAQQNKLGHRVCSVFIICVSGILAPLIATGVLLRHPILGGFLSASVVIATAISSNFQFNENWLSYRKTWDTLRREPHLRDARAADYGNAADRNRFFVERVEAIASDEGTDWLSRHLRQQEHPSGPRTSTTAASVATGETQGRSTQDGRAT